MEESIDKVFVTSGEDFTIKLESNPTTGYKWQPTYDDTYVKLISNDFMPAMQATKVLGAGGVERFFFRAIKSGNTEIEMLYKRVWEKKARKSRKITVNIR
jgi:inhibitor of cysteine peptidase